MVATTWPTRGDAVLSQGMPRCKAGQHTSKVRIYVCWTKQLYQIPSLQHGGQLFREEVNSSTIHAFGVELNTAYRLLRTILLYNLFWLLVWYCVREFCLTNVIVFRVCSTRHVTTACMATCPLVTSAGQQYTGGAITWPCCQYQY